MRRIAHGGATATRLLPLLLVAACSSRSKDQRSPVADGRLETNLHQKAFLEHWGQPTRTSTMGGADIVTAEWSGGSFSLRSNRNYDVWEYESRDTRLVFYRRRLVTWKTSKTVDELRSDY